MRRMVPAVLLVVAVCAAQVGVAHGAAIYQDSFNRVGLLNGSAPDVAPGSETWTSAGDVLTDGEVLTFGSDRRNMFLPFTPGSGVYELSVDVRLDPADSSSTWHALGFASLTSTPNDANNMAFGNDPEGGRPWVLLRNNGGAATFGGPGTQNGQGGPGTGTYAPDVFHTITLVLDTTGTAWTVDAYINGQAIISTFTYTENPNITSVGLSTGGGSGFVHTFDNFVLIPEPATMSLLVLGGLALLRRRRTA